MPVSRQQTNKYNGPAVAGDILAPTINIGLGQGVPIAATSTWSADSIFGGAVTSNASYWGFRFSTGTIDLTDRLYVVWQMAHTAFQRNNVATYANRGMVVVFTDGTNWSAFTVYGNEFATFSAAAEGAFAGFAGFGANADSVSSTYVLERTATPVASSGTLNWAAVTHVEVHVRPIASHTSNVAMGRIATCDRPIVTGTETSNVWATIRNNYGSSANGYVYPWACRPGALYTLSALNKPQVLQWGVQIGDGSTTTTVTDTKRGVSFWGQPADYDSASSSPPNACILISNPRLIDVFQAAADNVNLTDVSVTSTSGIGLRVRGNTAGNFTMTRGYFFKYAQMELGHGKFYSCTFDSGTSTVDITANTILQGSDVISGAGLRITGAAGDYSAITCSFSGNGTYDIQAGSGGAGTYTLTGISASSGYTLKLRNNHATNAVTFVIPSLPGVTISTSTAGGSITVSQPTITLTIAANISLVGAEIRIYDLDNLPAGSLGSALGGVESCPTATFAYVGTPGNAIWIQVMLDGYVEYGQQVTFPASSQTLVLPLTADTNA